MKYLKLLLIILGILAITVIIMNYLPSKLRTTYQKNQQEHFFSHKEENQAPFTLADLAGFPQPIVNYIQKMGYLGKARMNGMQLFFKEADFYLDQEKPKMTIDYYVTESSLNPKRIAYIDSQLYFLKFNGYDVFLNQQSRMQGELLNQINLFKQEGEDLRKGGLLTYLSEVFLMPSAIFNEAISFKELDSERVLATISIDGYDLQGVFEFNQEGEMVRFTTDQRPHVEADGKVHQRTWVAECLDYQVNNQGVKIPTRFVASWMIDGKKFDYFDGKISEIQYY
ncbi:DUF6544 family protein [Facklamia sp. 7083-14-GEN3]|uniref:DUF6544 family protein n=1 Tax=Facklamia sp. 7083-14-GEN3 TaxID=2973478 RepID=UPI00215BC9B6|nr:DUF6544 family protein [Facklamia sp. 7083-14-GEN3]MCR8969614.1 hypothetical protein [Facklamia sp. 7083-14-GEN3]